MSATEFPSAPGCFASALTYRADAPECRTCAFAAACGPRSQRKLAELRAKFGITPPESRAKSKEIADGGFTVPVKTAALLERIASLGVDVRGALRRGVNPFMKTGAPMFMAFVCHLLLRVDGGVTRSRLEDELAERFRWKRGTAAAHALQAIQALVALGAADEIDGRIIRRTDND